MATIIENARIIDGTGQPPIERGFVVIEGERIASVAPGKLEVVESGHEVVDAAGRSVVPGLVDCHVHLAGAHVTERLAEPSAARIADDALRVTELAGQLVRDGIVAVRDMGYPHHGIFAVRDALERRSFEGPRLFLSGRAIAASGGHGTGISVEIDGPYAARQAARLEMKAGADWLKLMVTGGTATPGEQVSDVQLALDEVQAVVEEAHRRGRRVAAHCSNLAGTRLALAAGVDSIEHGIELDEACVRQMVDNGVWLSPGLRCTEVEATAEPESGVADYVRAKAAAIFRRQGESFQLALAAGVRIVAATDGGPRYFPVGLESLVAELGTMVRLGMAPLDAIRAATSAAATLLGIDHEEGTIQPGRTANLVLVDGDPTAEVEALARPWLVVVRGGVVRRTGTGREER
jgi:imidazolonepropionase-like amidohydrolase